MSTPDAIIDELIRQQEKNRIYIRLGIDGRPTDQTTSFLVDGYVNLFSLAAAVDAANAVRISILSRGVDELLFRQALRGCPRARREGRA
jgi:hypothetical protein